MMLKKDDVITANEQRARQAYGGGLMKMDNMK